jgi:hypothetical protein
MIIIKGICEQDAKERKYFNQRDKMTGGWRRLHN